MPLKIKKKKKTKSKKQTLKNSLLNWKEAAKAVIERNKKQKNKTEKPQSIKRNKQTNKQKPTK